MVSKAAREFIAKHPDWNKPPKPKKRASAKKREKGEKDKE